MRRAVLDELRAARIARRPVALLTWLGNGEQRLCYDTDGGVLCEEIAGAARAALRDDSSTIIETPEGPVFVQAHCPSLRMLIVGAVHIAQALAPMAGSVGFDVTVIDPRRGFASAARFPGVALDSRWPHEALQALAPDRRSAVVTLCHDPKLDDPALRVAIASEAFYIAALGSRRSHAARLARLRASGESDAALARIHGPAGLGIGALGSAEIAVSVLAQVIAVRRRAAAG